MHGAVKKRRTKRIIKVLLVNILIFIFFASAAELTLGDWFVESVCCEGIGRDHLITCYDEDTYYTYCPEIVKILRLHPPDGWGKIYNYINRSGIRVERVDQIHQETKFDEYDVVNIGDSFLQADEIDFHETLSFVFSKNSGISALQVGYGSWAPITEYNFISGKKLKPGVVVNLFVMINDFTKMYYKSNIRYHNSFKTKLVDGKVKFIIREQKERRGSTISNDWIQYAIQRSYFIREIVYIHKQVILKQQSQDLTKYDFLSGDFSVLSDDCLVLNRIKQTTQMTPMAEDCLEFAFHSSCWSNETAVAVNNAITDIKRMVEYVETAGGKVNVFLVPAGFSFAGENMAGKKHFKISPGTTITTDGLADYLEKNLPTRFVSLEKIIDKLKEGYPAEKWYFPADGHWNRHAHSRLGMWLADFHASTMN